MVGRKIFNNWICIGVCDCALKLHFPVQTEKKEKRKKKKIDNDRARKQDKQNKIQSRSF